MVELQAMGDSQPGTPFPPDSDWQAEFEAAFPYQETPPITLRFLSLSEHREVIEAARELCESTYQQDPGLPGMALLAAQFIETDRVEYLDKS